MPEIYIWVVLLINQSEEIGEKQLSVFGSRGGKISPLIEMFVFLSLALILRHLQILPEVRLDNIINF